MKKRILNGIWVIMFLIGVMFWENSITVEAAMDDEAEEYDLGEVYNGSLHGGAFSMQKRYFKFTINEKSHTTLTISFKQNENDEYHYYANIYGTDGAVVLKEDDLSYSKNNVSEKYSAQQYRNLSAGTYYLAIEGCRVDFSFEIQAEKQIKLSKGVISSSKSAKKGQMTIKCQSAENAIGYRITYSTDYKFKKNVKKVYSPTVSKTITGLKAGQRYYVKVCPYTVYDDGVMVYGQNSYVRAVVVKKK